MPWTRKEKGLILGNLAVTIILAILLASALSGAFTAQEVQQPQQVRLVIEHYNANGQLVDTRVKEGDLFLKNYAMIIQAMFDKTYSADFTVTDMSATTRYIHVWSENTKIPFNNAGFEYGDLTNWTADPANVSILSTSPVEGKYYARTSDSAQGEVLKSPIFKLGQYLNYWFVASGGAGTFNVRVYRASDNLLLFDWSHTDIASWTYYQQDTSTQAGVEAYIAVNDPYNAAGALIDGFSVTYSAVYGSGFFDTRRDKTSIKIHVGTGTTAPTITDTALVSEVDAQEVNLVSYSESGNTMTITVQTTFTFTASYAITEVGLSFSDYSAASASGGKPENVSTGLLVFRDTFTAVNVASGDSLVVKYQIQFNA
jgi:hypothetical protein